MKNICKICKINTEEGRWIQMDKIIMFEQKGDGLFEGELLCGVCGYRGKATLNDALAHKQGYHNII